MDSMGARGAFAMDSTARSAAPHGFDAYLREWETLVGDTLPLPTFSEATIRDFRVKGRAAKVRDVVITDAHCASPVQTAGNMRGVEDLVRLYVVQRGAWTLGGDTISAGQFVLRHVARPLHFKTVPHTRAKILTMPTAMLKPLLGDRIITGPADSSEVRLLVAHVNMVQTMMTDLSPAGVHAAHSALLELAKAVAIRRFDDVEPLLTPALVQTAKDIANSRLAEPELSPAMLARELHVSVRTLQRAFAATGESVSAHIRYRRLEEARLALTAPAGRLSVSELAAHWQFADSSHFIRAFKRHYGKTPTEYAQANSVRCT